MTKIGIIIPVYNRPALVKQTLDCLNNTLPLVDEFQVELIIMDDNSNDIETQKLIADFELNENLNWNITKGFFTANRGIAGTLKWGFEQLIDLGCDILCNLDSDVLLKPYWLKALLRLHMMKPDLIISGFGFNNHDRYCRKFKEMEYCLKPATGGINYMFATKNYDRWFSPALKFGKYWDSNLWTIFRNENMNDNFFVVTLPSVIEHTGIEFDTHPRVADDFNVKSKIFE